jgi:hypothetical protein
LNRILSANPRSLPSAVQRENPDNLFIGLVSARACDIGKSLLVELLNGEAAFNPAIDDVPQIGVAK